MIEGHNFWCPLMVNLTIKLDWLIGHGFDSWNGKKHLFRQDETTWMCNSLKISYAKDFKKQKIIVSKVLVDSNFSPMVGRLSQSLPKMMIVVTLMMMMMMMMMLRMRMMMMNNIMMCRTRAEPCFYCMIWKIWSILYLRCWYHGISCPISGRKVVPNPSYDEPLCRTLCQILFLTWYG